MHNCTCNFFFGTITPIIIERLSEYTLIKQKGSVAGKVYAVSTFGGIVGTFSFGLYLIPYCGLNFSTIVMAASLFVAAILSLIK